MVDISHANSAKIALNQIENAATAAKNPNVLVIDDVLDTGHTLAKVREHLCTAGAEDVRICVLLDKPSRRVVPGQADFVGFSIDDVFVVGYGLDLDDAWRTLPYVGIVKE